MTSQEQCTGVLALFWLPEARNHSLLTTLFFIVVVAWMTIYHTKPTTNRREGVGKGGGPPQLATHPLGNSTASDKQDPGILLDSGMLVSSPPRGSTSSTHSADSMQVQLQVQHDSSCSAAGHPPGKQPPSVSGTSRRSFSIDTCTTCLWEVNRCRCRRPAVAYDLCFGPRLG